MPSHPRQDLVARRVVAVVVAVVAVLYVLSAHRTVRTSMSTSRKAAVVPAIVGLARTLSTNVHPGAPDGIARGIRRTITRFAVLLGGARIRRRVGPLQLLGSTKSENLANIFRIIANLWLSLGCGSLHRIEVWRQVADAM